MSPSKPNTKTFSEKSGKVSFVFKIIPNTNPLPAQITHTLNHWGSKHSHNVPHNMQTKVESI